MSEPPLEGNPAPTLASSSSSTAALSASTMLMLGGFAALLMVFSVVTWKLGNDTLAAAAGAGAIALIADIGRRLLGHPATTSMVPNRGGPPPNEATCGDGRAS